MEIHVIHIAVYKSLCISVLIKTCSLISNVGLVKQKTEGTNEGAPALLNCANRLELRSVVL